jgi:hypothetical protein
VVGEGAGIEVADAQDSAAGLKGAVALHEAAGLAAAGENEPEVNAGNLEVRSVRTDAYVFNPTAFLFGFSRCFP